MRQIRIDRVELQVSGVDATTVAAALRALPRAVARHLAERPAVAGSLRVSQGIGPTDLADRLAAHLAGAVHQRADADRQGRG